MTSTIKLLDRWKASQGIASDNAAALALEVSRQAASRWRNGLAQAEPHTIARMAKDIGEDPGAWMALVEAERAKSSEDRKAWMALARQLGAAAAVAAVALLSVGVIDVSAQDGVHSAASAMLLNVVGGMHYAKFSVELSAAFGRNYEASEVSRS